jgi:hypothetical protein
MAATEFNNLDIHEALQCYDAEVAQLQKLETFELVSLPEDCKIIGCWWVLTMERSMEGEIIKYKAKAQLIAQRFSQIPGMDFDETFSLVMWLESFKVLLANCNSVGPWDPSNGCCQGISEWGITGGNLHEANPRIWRLYMVLNRQPGLSSLLLSDPLQRRPMHTTLTPRPLMVQSL